MAPKIVESAKRKKTDLVSECECVLDQDADCEKELIRQKEKIEMLEAELTAKDREISELKRMILTELAQKNIEIAELKRMIVDMQSSSSNS